MNWDWHRVQVSLALARVRNALDGEVGRTLGWVGVVCLGLLVLGSLGTTPLMLLWFAGF